jgi:propanediol dehydratase large subunit
MANWLNENNAAEGQMVEMSGSPAKIVQVIPKMGIIVETQGAGMKMRITYSFTELSMRGAKIIEG